MLAILLALLAPLLGPGSAAGGQDRDPGVEQADSLVAGGDLEAGMAVLEAVLSEASGDYAALWRCASVAVALGVVAEREGRGDEASRRYERAESCADAAVRVRPEAPEGRYWRVAALGRRALSAGRREAAALSEEIREGALSILADHPDHAGAHNALGRLHFEIVALSGVTRFLGRTFLGGRALAEASWEEAERHLRRAVELEPEMALFRLDFGRYLMRAGRDEEARLELRAVAEGTPLNPADEVFRQEAAALLRRIER